ncbi:unnamed protein product, partial [Closterium sp. NIES-53]
MTAGDSLPGTGWFASGINTAQHLSPNLTASSGVFRAASRLVDSSNLVLSDSHFVITAIVAAVAVLISTSWLSFLRRRRSLPPGPSPWPIFGNLPDLGLLPFRSLAKLADRYGPILTVWYGSTPSVVISSPELARENIVFSPPNDRWRKLRRLATLHLLSAKKLQESLPVREGEVREMLDAIAADVAGTADAAADGATTSPSDVAKTGATTTGGAAKFSAVAEEGSIIE